ncbi:MAG: aldo/keto reductase [Oscillospiraceae bacterium]|nr:aldo/keto reductase [Oscillospiraceae bacterium]
MKYRTNPKTGEEISALSFGCMRLPKDEREAGRLISHAVEQGINYFDTAYIYPGNEAKIGKLLSGGLRERVKLATKLPPFLVNKTEDFIKILEAQLQRLKTDRIDYYLIHMLNGLPEWERLVRLGADEWIQREKERGRIAQIGFSFHGPADAFPALCDAYEWEHCMIQYNYYDQNYQAGESGLEHAAVKGLPVIIMEPVRGGWLAGGIPKQARDIFAAYHPKRTPAEWSLRWLWNQPGVTSVLSGMDSFDVLQENLNSCQEASVGCFSQKDNELISKVKEVLQGLNKIPCTACGYCMPCPARVDIPLCFSIANDRGGERSKMANTFKYITYLGNRNSAACNGCGKCEKLCPQGISIAKELAGVKKTIERGLYRPMRFFVRKFMKDIIEK